MDVVKRNGKWVPLSKAGDLQPGEVIGLDCSDMPSMTRQSEAEACDINTIVAQFDRTGMMPQVSPGMFADVSEVGDYQSALETVRLADEMFMQLPAKVRHAFDDDPAVFVDAFHDASRKDELVALGLLPKEAPTESKAPTSAAGAAAGSADKAPVGS